MKIILAFLLSFVLAQSLSLQKRSMKAQRETVQEKIFETWKAKYNKNYKSSEEESFRFENFKASLARIEQKNQKGNPVFGLTKFSDLSTTEFKKTYLTYVPRNISGEVARVSLQAPNAYDWGQQDRVTPVKDQGQCGSCWAFSATENIESVYMILNNIGSASMNPLGPQELVDCVTADNGCSGGYPSDAFTYVISAGGMETESNYPYSAQNGNCAFDKSKVSVQITNWKYATQSQSETDMINVAYSIAPLSVCVDASSWQDYTGGVLTADQCSTSIDHCVQAVGWDTTASTPFWNVRNSWGADWGQNGYIQLEYGTNTCGIASIPTTACINNC